jgi:hypothetical protein
MTFPDACPNCGAVPRSEQPTGRMHFACESWINEGREMLNYKTETCCDRRTIKEAAAVIRAFLDGDRDAREMGQDWIAENTP